jgi:hypothetical protein
MQGWAYSSEEDGVQNEVAYKRCLQRAWPHLVCIAACIQQHIRGTLAVAQQAHHPAAQLLLQVPLGQPQLFCF